MDKTPPRATPSLTADQAADLLACVPAPRDRAEWAGLLASARALGVPVAAALAWSLEAGHTEATFRSAWQSRGDAGASGNRLLWRAASNGWVMPMRRGTAQAEDARVLDAPARRPGRPAKGARALSPAERQRASRRRRHEAALSAADDLQAADDAALLAGLALRLKDARTDGDAGDTARWVAGRIVGELCRRHGIELRG